MKYLLAIFVFLILLSEANAKICKVHVSTLWKNPIGEYVTVKLTDEEIKAEVHNNCKRKDTLYLTGQYSEESNINAATYLCNLGKEILTSDSQLVCIIK
jgi:hypothetical protein|tara:strand:- start:924 stop:1220 length:297 start_codon:yes stop_codon:yes gene_type:complete